MDRKNTWPLGSSPVHEKCALLGTPDYGVRAQIECKVYVQQIMRAFIVAHGRSPLGVELVVRSNNHAFGEHFDVAMVFGDGDEQATADAIWLENNTPEEWDDVSVGKLRDKGFVVEPCAY